MKKSKGPTVRQRFLDKFAHKPSDHVPSYVSEDGHQVLMGGRISRDQLANWKRMPWKRRLESFPTGDCPYWFCVTPPPDGDSQWESLLKAMEVLEDAGIDPHGQEVQALVGEHHTVKSWGEQLPHFEALVRSFEGVKPPPGTFPYLFREKFLRDLAPPLEIARKKWPPEDRPGPRTNFAKQGALALAQGFNWTPAVVSAVLLLSGIERGKWKPLLDKTRNALSRVVGYTMAQKQPR